MTLKMREGIMEDGKIIELYWGRSESAISATSEKYGGYLYAISHRILRDDGDSEECVNDTYLKAWDSMPPERPKALRFFLGKITRNLSLDRYRTKGREKRGGGQVEESFEELKECFSAAQGIGQAGQGARKEWDPENAVDQLALRDCLSRFLGELSRENRAIFLQRYWYFLSIKEIAEGLQMGESKVKMSLFRTRENLKSFLEKEGILP